MFTATIDGQTHTLPEGISLLEAIRRIGGDLPTLCWDERVEATGGCRLCSVEVAGAPHPVAACQTPLADGMIVATKTPALEAFRRFVLYLLAADYPADAVARFPEKEFHRLLARYGVTAGGERRGAYRDDAHPYIAVDMALCVDCLRCVGICKDLQGEHVFQVWNRGGGMEVVPGRGGSLLESGCVSCGACADTCPTGAIEDKTILRRGMPAVFTRTVCPYCGTGCELEVGTREGRIVTIRPVRGSAVSHGHLCAKGRYAFDYLTASDRAAWPMLRENGVWRRVTWGEATGFVASRLERILDEHGSSSTAILGSARGTNEENYVAQKFARVVLGTNNVDCCVRVGHAPSEVALACVLGTGAATSSFDDIEMARTLFVFGANATENHPVVGARIRRAARRGAHLVVVDPRRTALAEAAEVHLQLKPGTNLPLLFALARVILDEGLADDTFLARRVEGLELFRESVSAWTPELAAGVCGVPAALIERAARLYALEKPSICFHGLGATEHVQGTDAVEALVNLALLTGNVGRPGTGVNPLRGQNNVQGAAHMGCEPNHLAGYAALGEGRALVERVVGAKVPEENGLSLPGMLEAAREGRLHALWVIGYDLLLTNPGARVTEDALEALDLLVVEDLFLNETARRFAHVFLPAAASFEKDGTFMNAERRVQRVRRVVAPHGEARPDWQILADVARAMGKGAFFPYRSAEEIWDEVRAVWPAGRGMTYRRLDERGLQWPCASEGEPGTERLHVTEFAAGPRVRLQPLVYEATPEVTSEEFPFLLTTGRTLMRFNAGTMTARTKNALLEPTDTLSISPTDAARLSLGEGASVRVTSRYGAAVLPAALRDDVRPGELFATFHDPAVFLNRLTSPRCDGETGTPEYKVTAVRVAKAP